MLVRNALEPWQGADKKGHRLVESGVAGRDENIHVVCPFGGGRLLDRRGPRATEVDIGREVVRAVTAGTSGRISGELGVVMLPPMLSNEVKDNVAELTEGVWGCCLLGRDETDPITHDPLAALTAEGVIILDGGEEQRLIGMVTEAMMS